MLKIFQVGRKPPRDTKRAERTWRMRMRTSNGHSGCRIHSGAVRHMAMVIVTFFEAFSEGGSIAPPGGRGKGSKAEPPPWYLAQRTQQRLRSIQLAGSTKEELLALDPSASPPATSKNDVAFGQKPFGSFKPSWHQGTNHEAVKLVQSRTCKPAFLVLKRMCVSCCSAICTR